MIFPCVQICDIISELNNYKTILKVLSYQCCLWERKHSWKQIYSNMNSTGRGELQFYENLKWQQSKRNGLLRWAVLTQPLPLPIRPQQGASSISHQPPLQVLWKMVHSQTRARHHCKMEMQLRSLFWQPDWSALTDYDFEKYYYILKFFQIFSLKMLKSIDLYKD